MRGNNSSSSSSSLTIPTWMLSWLLISFPLILYDAAFILTRPASQPSGSLHHIFWPYDTYVRYDPVYGDTTDAFGIAQSYLNLVEIALQSIALLLLTITSSSLPHLLILISSAATWFKTVLYLVYAIIESSMAAKHGYDMFDVRTWDAGYVLAFIIPTSFWVIFPIAVVISLGGQFVKVVDGKTARKKRE